MTYQLLKRYFFSLLLITLSTKTQAQISTKATMIEANLGFNQSKTPLFNTNHPSFHVEIGKMLVSNLMIVGGLDAMNNDFSSRNLNTFNLYSISKTSARGTLGLRYYPINTAKAGVFGFANVSFYNSQQTEKGYQNSSNTNVNFTDNSLAAKFGLGLDLPISSNVLLESSVWYEKIMQNVFDDQYLYFTTGIKNLKLGTWKGEAPEDGFVHKGRMTIGGNIGFRLPLNSDPSIEGNGFKLIFNPSFTIFILDNLEIGLDNQGFNIKNSYNTPFYFPEYYSFLFARYYVPISKNRFFVTPDIRTANAGLSLGVGASYFLNSSLEIQSSFINFSFLSSYSAFDKDNSILKLQFGLRYFIR
jgi:hypothetical protein